MTVLAVAFERRAVYAERAGDQDAAAAWTVHRDAVEAAVLAGNAAASTPSSQHPTGLGRSSGAATQSWLVGV